MGGRSELGREKLVFIRKTVYWTVTSKVRGSTVIIPFVIIFAATLAGYLLILSLSIKPSSKLHFSTVSVSGLQLAKILYTSCDSVAIFEFRE